MSNPDHTPKVEAEMIIIEALRRIVKHPHFIEHFMDDVTPAYRRDVKRHLAKIHNKLLNESGFDGVLIDVDSINLGA
jgi:hypothetical protein